MTLKAYIWVIRLAAVFSLVAFLAVLFLIDPAVSGWAGQVLFFLSFIFLISSLAHCLIVSFKTHRLGELAVARSMKISLRQSFLWGIASAIAIIMQIIKFPLFLNLGIALAFLIISDLYFRWRVD